MDECHKLLTNKVDLVNPEGHQILRNIYEPLLLGGPPGQLKAARYLDFGLEELVPSLWVESEREYDISAAYGITHWWFRRKEFYINKHSEPSDREAVRSQMRILSVISVKVFEKYGYNYLREIILRQADYQEYKISEKDFKNLHPNDFEDLQHVDKKPGDQESCGRLATSKRQPGTGGSNEGTGNILVVPDESTVISRASSEGTGSKPGVPDEEKLILEWEADVVSEHFDRDDNAEDDNEETKPDPEEIYK
ncbi:hypothetical protein Tco_1096846 [Tanacetum coccineum]